MDVTHRDTVTVTGVVLDQTGQPVTRGQVQSKTRTVLTRVARDAARVAGIPRATTGATNARRPIPWAAIRAWAAWATKAAIVLLAAAVAVTVAVLMHRATGLGRVAILVGVAWALTVRWALLGGRQRTSTPGAPHRKPTRTPAPDPQVTITCTVTDHPGARQRALPAGRRAITQ